MNICILLPPVIDPSMPWLAIYQLQSFIKNNLPECNVDAVDLNISFFNNIIENPYKNFNDNNLFNAYFKIKEIEKQINMSFENWSTKFKVGLGRQSLSFNFNQNSSKELSQFIEIENDFYHQLAELLMKSVDVMKYEIVCFSITCYEQLITSLILSKIIKNVKKDITIAVGGNVISRIYEHIFNITNISLLIDYLIIKEGELPLINLILLKNNSNIKYNTNSLFSVKTKEIIDSSINPEFVDIYKLPETKFLNIKLDLYFSPIPILPISLSRGCSWGKCTFCGIHSTWCSSYRKRSTKDVVDEIENHIKVHKVKCFRLVDESPSIKDILSFSKEIIKRKLDIRIEAYTNIVKILQKGEVARILYLAGFRQLFFGIESIDSDVLKISNKNINNPSFYIPILNNLTDNGISNYGFFMIGLPHDNIENEGKLLSFIISCDSLNTIAISSFLPVTNSKMVTDNNYTKRYDIKYTLRGDLTTRCDYTIRNIFVEAAINDRVKKMLSTIFQARPDLFISSNLPYEARFYLCIKYGNLFSREIANSVVFNYNSNEISNELSARADGLL